MKKFKFTLEKYLEMKVGDDGKLKRELGQVNAEIKQINAVIFDIEDREAKERSQYSQKCKNGVTGGQLHEYSQYMGYLNQNKMEHIKKLNNLTQKSDEYKEKLVTLTNEIKALSRMKEEQKRAYYKEIEADEARMLDDFVSFKAFSSL